MAEKKDNGLYCVTTASQDVEDGKWRLVVDELGFIWTICMYQKLFAQLHADSLEEGEWDEFDVQYNGAPPPSGDVPAERGALGNEGERLHIIAGGSEERQFFSRCAR